MSSKKTEQEQEIQLMVWYNEEDWGTLKALFSDADLMPETHQEWLNLAEKKVKQLEKSGMAVAKVTIDTVMFPKWCKENNMQMDAEARTTFAIKALQQQQFMDSM